MLNVLYVNAGRTEPAAAGKEALGRIKTRIHPGQADLVAVRFEQVTSPDRLAEILAGRRYDLLHLVMPAGASGDVERSPGTAVPTRESERDLVGPPLDQAGVRERPCVLLDGCPADQASQFLPGSFPCLIELPAQIDPDSRESFLAAFYETLTFGYTLQTAFWLGCCQTKSAEAPGTERLRIRSARGYDPRKTTYNIESAAEGTSATASGASCPHSLEGGGMHRKLDVAPKAREFFDRYRGLCDTIKDTIAAPLFQRFDELLAMVYDGRGPVSVEQEVEFSNDFAGLIIAIYRGPAALELQREILGRYKDPSGRHVDLYDWTVCVEVGEAQLETWLTDKTRVAYEAYDAGCCDQMGPDWKSQVIEAQGCEGLARIFNVRDMDFAHAAANEFARLMRELYLVLRGDSMTDMPVLSD